MLPPDEPGTAGAAGPHLLVADESALPAALAVLAGALALDAVRTATDLDTPAYVWAAGEARLPTGVRRHLVAGRGLPSNKIAFIGYWRHGRSSPG
ncbi:SIP domain-containing protein [Actinoplanes sp. NPDC051494]|uniref:SIP domain-containing protein n=1 Tax=Actinoplanes sp. NPDC051494 TaxID=3363907 RepID=UPI0037ACEDCB